MPHNVFRFVVAMLAALSFAVAVGHNGPVPDNWTVWRASWEWGQAANGVAQLLGFAAIIASLVTAEAAKSRR